MKRAVIVHGFEGHPEENWLPWLKSELEQHGYRVTVPQFPDAGAPQQREWIAALDHAIQKPDEHLVLIGHSLGAITIMRYLEQLAPHERVGEVVFVAGFSEKLEPFTAVYNFFRTPVQYDRVKRAAKHFTIIQSDNDPYVPFERGTLMHQKLGGDFITLHGAGHVNTAAGYTQLPEALHAVVRKQ